MFAVPEAGEYNTILRDFKRNGRDKKRRRKQISYNDEDRSVSHTSTKSSSLDTRV